jgi:hypothetical protein
MRLSQKGRLRVAHNPGISSNRISRLFNTSWTPVSSHRAMISSFKAANADVGSVPLCALRLPSWDPPLDDVALRDLMSDFQSLFGRTQRSRCRLATSSGEIILVKFVSIKRRGDRLSRMRWRFRVLGDTAVVDSHSSFRISRIRLIDLHSISSRCYQGKFGAPNNI